MWEITLQLSQILSPVLLIIVIFKINHIMATFSDIQASLSQLDSAVTNITSALTTAQAGGANGITAANGDTIVAAINSAVNTLNTAASTPAA